MGRLAAWYEQVWPDAQELVPILTEQLRTAILSAPSLDGLLDSVSVTGRVKTPTSTLRKLLRDVDHVESVRDVLAFRVVLKASGTASQELAATMSKPGSRLLSDEEVEALLCYGAYKQVLRLWPEVPGRFKDFISSPKANGYQSIHTNVRLTDGRVLEVQLRSAAMHEKAERGAAAHGLYKGGIDNPGALAELADVSTTLRTLRELPALPQGALFAQIDTDQSGFIEPSELQNALRLAGRDSSDEAVEREFSLLDTDGDGRISIEEFSQVSWDLGSVPKESILIEPLSDNDNGVDGARGSDAADPGSSDAESPVDIQATASGPSRKRRRRGRRTY